ncbi:VOC family protein [Brevibacterium metallidurans]|uniref:VOC family protein n=1 Tax=Brevibacterium metallidurans TaxID=1482676 RepID=A0ABN0SIM6_9MICO
MERVNGIGGYFLRSDDPEALSAWYQDMLGIDTTDGVWRQAEGPTVVAAFEAKTDYFGSRDGGFGQQQTMLNFRVDDLDAMLEQLQAAEADVDDEIQEMEGIGRFGWVTDPEGNRIELWEPSPEALAVDAD